MPNFKVDIDGMGSNGRSTIDYSDAFNEEVGVLTSLVEDLSLNQWSGAAATNFNEAYENQKDNLTAFRELLAQLGNYIVQGSNTFQKAEDDNIAEIKSKMGD